VVVCYFFEQLFGLKLLFVTANIRLRAFPSQPVDVQLT
jgi:hypothetical protein